MIDKKVLVTGGRGFIGQKLIEKFPKDYSVSCIDIKDGYDILDESTFKDLEGGLVIHLAAIIRPKEEDEMLRVNVNGTYNVLEFCRKKKADLIFASTAAVYGNVLSPIKEDSEQKPMSLYGVTKMAGERLCEYYNRQHGIDCTILRIFNIYGPGQQRGLLIPDIIQKMKEEKINLQNPDSRRDFVYIDDAIDAIILSLDLSGFHTINIGSGESHSVREVAEMMTKKTINYETKLPNSDIYADITSAKNILNWEPKVSLEEGLRRTIEK